MISSYLNNDLEKMRELAFRIIETNNSREVDTCTKPSCGNAAYAYLFLIYEANQNNDQKKVDEYLQEYILSYIPFQKCFICEKQINILDESNYLFIIYNILYCSKKCVNIECFQPY